MDICVSIFYWDMDIKSLAFIAKYDFPIRKWALLYQVLFCWGVYEQNSIVKSVHVDEQTNELSLLVMIVADASCEWIFRQIDKSNCRTLRFLSTHH